MRFKGSKLAGIPGKVIAPLDYRPWEWAFARLAFGYLMLQTFRMSRAYIDGKQLDDQPLPNGLARVFDMTWVADPAFGAVIVPVVYVCLLLYVLGIGLPVVLPVLLFEHVAAGTLVNSQGYIHHNSQIIGYVMIGQVLAVWWGWGRRRFGGRSASHGGASSPMPARGAGTDGTGDGPSSDEADTGDGVPPSVRARSTAQLAMQMSVAMIAAGYVVSGVSKLVRSGGEWIQNIPNIALQVEKNARAEFYNHLDPTVLEGKRQIIDLIAKNPNLSRIFFGAGLFLELFAFVALFSRWWSLAMGFGLILLHVTVTQVMHLGFYNNKFLLMVFFVGPLYWLVKIDAWRGKRLNAASPGPSKH